MCFYSYFQKVPPVEGENDTSPLLRGIDRSGTAEFAKCILNRYLRTDISASRYSFEALGKRRVPYRNRENALAFAHRSKSRRKFARIQLTTS